MPKFFSILFSLSMMTISSYAFSQNINTSENVANTKENNSKHVNLSQQNNDENNSGTEIRFSKQDLSAIPPEVTKWVPWVQKDNLSKDCPQNTCAYLPQLRLSENKQNIVMTMNGVNFHQDTWVKLPFATTTSTPLFPNSVSVNGQKAVMEQKDNIPFLKLPKDTIKIELTYNKDALTRQSNIILPYTPVSFFNNTSLSLSLNQNNLILNKDSAQTNNTDKPEINLLVYRKLTDGMPLMLTTRIKIDYSGHPDEINLGKILPQEFLLQNAQSDLNVYYKDNNYWVSAIPGSHFIELNAFLPKDINYIETTGLVNNVKDEIWSFQSNPNFRKVQIEAALPVDTKQAAVPDEWKNFPAWQVKEKLVIKTERRGGVFDTPLKSSTIKRSWFGLNGNILQTQDNISLINENNQFVKFLTDNIKIESAKLNNENQLIVTKDSAPTILLPRGNSNLQVFSTALIGSSVSTSALDAENEVNDWNLFLAPRYRLLMIKHANVAGSWIDSWSLYSVFFLCLLTIVCWKLLGKNIAILAALYVIVFQTTIVWSWFIWIPFIILIALASTKTVQKNEKAALWVKVLMLTSFIFSVLNVIPFISTELRSIINPVVDVKSGTTMFSNITTDASLNISDILSMLCYIGGIAFGLKAALTLKQQHENPAQNKKQLSKSIILAIIAAILLSLPTLLSTSKGMVFGIDGTGTTLNDISSAPSPAPAPVSPQDLERKQTYAPEMNMRIQSDSFQQRNLNTEKIQVGVGEPSWNYNNNYHINLIQKAKQVEFYIASPLWVNIMGVIQILLIIVLLYNILVYIMYVNKCEKWLEVFPSKLTANALTKSFIQHAKNTQQGV